MRVLKQYPLLYMRTIIIQSVKSGTMLILLRLLEAVTCVHIIMGVWLTHLKLLNKFLTNLFNML